MILIATTLLPADEEKVPLDKVPKAVMEAVKKRFNKAEVVEASKETTDGKTVFEVTLKQAGKNIDVMLTPEGDITLIEKEITAKQLPKGAKAAVDKKYPKHTWTMVEEVIKVEAGKEKLDYYEVHLETPDKKEIEVKIAPDGSLKEEDKEAPGAGAGGYTSDFSADKDALASTGKNPFFILEPGYQLTLEGGKERIVITVLNETKMVDGVECRVVEERESKNDKLVEVSRNYFAISKRTNNVYYFGEDVDEYKEGKVVGHPGSWLSGVNGAKFGLMMPGLPLLGARYQQEVAPKVAMDRAEVVAVDVAVKTPAGEFKNCLKLLETTPLEPGPKEHKVYAPGVGLAEEGDMKLVKYGKVELQK
jgi:hypothetical protein